jgi:hypothetical protein
MGWGLNASVKPVCRCGRIAAARRRDFHRFRNKHTDGGGIRKL